MENVNDFVPMMIGKRDEKNYQLIVELYETLVTLLGPFKWECESVLKVADLPIWDILNILNMDKGSMENYLKRSYLEANELSFPGLKVDKLIQNDLIELPEEYNIALVAKKEIETVIEKILKTSFQFPITRLFVEEEGFTLTEEFKNELAKHTESMTESQIQNEVLTAVEKFCEAVNDLIGLGVVRSEGSMWHIVGERLMFSIENTKGSLRPLSPDRKMFRRSPLNRFNVNKGFVGSDRRRCAVVR